MAIVGSSGAGKTTLVNLLPRFHDATSGSLQIDGFEVNHVTLRSLREQMAIVTQETILFNDTVWNNLCYGRPDLPEARVVAAAKAALAHDFITQLPQGYQTRIGDRGQRLSGGQRQRLAIARALLKDAPILILDEATSELDSESEHLVQRALNNLMTGRTVFVIAHRLSTIRRADMIAVLDGGTIRELGTHEELLANGAMYRRLYEMQFWTPICHLPPQDQCEYARLRRQHEPYETKRMPKSPGLKSMTGYAQARREESGRVIRVTLRSVNHRFLDIHVKAPEGFESLENGIRQAVRAHLRRGHVDVILHYDSKRPSRSSSKSRSSRRLSNRRQILRKEFGLTAEPDLAGILRLPGVVTPPESLAIGEDDQLATILQSCLNRSSQPSSTKCANPKAASSPRNSRTACATSANSPQKSSL